MLHVTQTICGSVSRVSIQNQEAHALTGDQRVPDWLLASFLGWRSCKAFVVSKRLLGRGGEYWEMADQRVAYTIFGEAINLEALYLEARRKPVDFGQMKGQ